jgi:hypothetical protein
MRKRPSDIAATITASDGTAELLRKKVTQAFRPAHSPPALTLASGRGTFVP